MRVVIQRVIAAEVVIEASVTRAIQKGIVVLLAIEDKDTADDVAWLSGKIVRLRIFDDEEGVMNRSVQEVDGEILLISQFTLFGSTKKGNRPSYSRSARPEFAIPFYERFIAQLEQDLGKADPSRKLRSKNAGQSVERRTSNDHYRFEDA